MTLGFLGFAALPVDAGDVRTLAEHLTEPGRIAHQVYHRLALIDAGTAPRLGAVLSAARHAWAARWFPRLADGWRSGGGEGALGRIGGVSQAVWNGRETIVRDSAAVAVGYAMVVALWVGLVAMGLSLVVSTAEAAVDAASGDIARKILTDMLPVFGAGTLLAQGLGRMALILSLAATTVAGISAIWQASIMLVEYTTAPDGARQRHSPWLFCLRIAVGIGLLVPIHSGYGVGQVLVANLARWGSDKASVAWTSIASALSDRSNFVAAPTVPDTSLLLVVRGTAALEACRAAITGDPARANWERVQLVQDGRSLRYDYQRYGILGWSTEVAGGCGTITMPEASGSTASVATAHAAAWKRLQGDLGPIIASFVAMRIACRDGSPTCSDDASPTSIGSLPTVYRAYVESAVTNALTSSNSDARAALSAVATAEGWIGAGRWTQQLSTLQGSLSTASTALPRVTPPLLPVNEYAEAASLWVARGLIESGNKTAVAEVGLASGTPGAEEDMLHALGSSLWSVAADYDAASPMTSIASVGYTLYGTGSGMLVASAVVGAIGGDKPSGVGGAIASAAAKAIPGGTIISVLGKSLDTIKSVLNALGFALIIAGAALAYVVPAPPFVRFYFSIIGWVIAVFECVLLTPVLLVLMVSSEAGGGIFGSAARACVLQVVGLMLRPLLSVIGLVVGLVAISAGIAVLNEVMLPLMRNIMEGIVPITFAGFVAYAVIYTVLAYVTVNICTKTAEMLPQAAYRWLGATAAADADHGTALSGALGWLSGRLGVGAIGRRKGAR